jgi:hypothetical protein
MNTIIFFDRHICGLAGDTESVLPNYCSTLTFRNAEVSLIIFFSCTFVINQLLAPVTLPLGMSPCADWTVWTPEYCNNVLQFAKLAQRYRYVIRNETPILRQGIGYACFPFVYRMGLGTSSNWKKLQNNQDICNFYHFPGFKMPCKNGNHLIRIYYSDNISWWCNHVVCLSHA